jgi:hypothetical protein
LTSRLAERKLDDAEKVIYSSMYDYVTITPCSCLS